jgi:cAMP phosphodiesterase
MLTSPLS